MAITNNDRKMSPLKMGLGKKQIPALNGIRALSVFAVIISHAGYFPIGSLGVITFFVLSGFLITTLLIREYDRFDSVSFSAFFKRRAFRIFPAYYVFLILSFCIDRVTGDERIDEVFAYSLFYLTNYYNAFNGHVSTSVAHAWSLGVEEQFYIIWPVVFIMLVKFNFNKAVGCLLFLLLFVIGWRTVAYVYYEFDVSYIYNAFETRFDSLAVGCLLAFLLKNERVLGILARFLVNRFLVVLFLGLLVFLHLLGGSEYRYTIGFSVSSILIAVLLMNAIAFHQYKSWMWLDSQVMQGVGIISYPMYLYHNWGLAIGEKLPVDSGFIKFLVGVVVIFLLSIGSYFIIEKPFLRLKARYERVKAT